jgi:hypothetical protein
MLEPESLSSSLPKPGKVLRLPPTWSFEEAVFFESALDPKGPTSQRQSKDKGNLEAQVHDKAHSGEKSGALHCQP